MYRAFGSDLEICIGKFYCNYSLILIMEKKSQNRDFDHVHEHVLEHKFCNNETL